jgi:hypothetical protein
LTSVRQKKNKIDEHQIFLRCRYAEASTPYNYYCPTDERNGDFFRKPVGGAKFRCFYNIIMNISHNEYGPVDMDELTTIHN